MVSNHPLNIYPEENAIAFYVINGAWEGTYFFDKQELGFGFLKQEPIGYEPEEKWEMNPERHHAELLWFGDIPMDHFDYNEAIAWIEDFISGKIETGIPEIWEEPEEEDDDIPY